LRAQLAAPDRQRAGNAMNDRVEEGLSQAYPIKGAEAGALYARVCVTAEIDGRAADEMLLMHPNQLTSAVQTGLPPAMLGSRRRRIWAMARRH